MAISAYILLNLITPKLQDTLSAIRAIDEVRSCDGVTGPYDAVAFVEAEDINALGQVVTTKISAVEGVAKTLTCVAVK